MQKVIFYGLFKTYHGKQESKPAGGTVHHHIGERLNMEIIKHQLLSQSRKLQTFKGVCSHYIETVI